MALNLETLRRECAQRLYEETYGVINNTPWFKLKQDVRNGYLKMAGTIFDELFKQDSTDLFEFFAETDLDTKVRAEGWLRPDDLAIKTPSQLSDIFGEATMEEWAEENGYVLKEDENEEEA